MHFVQVKEYVGLNYGILIILHIKVKVISKWLPCLLFSDLLQLAVKCDHLIFMIKQICFTIAWSCAEILPNVGF